MADIAYLWKTVDGDGGANPETWFISETEACFYALHHPSVYLLQRYELPGLNPSIVACLLNGQSDDRIKPTVLWVRPEKTET